MGHRTKLFGAQMDVKLNRTVCVCVCVCTECVYLSLSLWQVHIIGSSSLLSKGGKKTDSGSQLSVADTLCVCVRVCISVCSSVCLYMCPSSCRPLCCLVAILSAGNQCVAHCRNGPSNSPPFQASQRHNGYTAKCLSCHQRTVRQAGRLNADR